MYWDHTYEDVMNVIARLPEVCALIYRCTYHDGVVPKYDASLDYSGNFCKMLGFDNEGFMELMRLYIVIHSDHEWMTMYSRISSMKPSLSKPSILQKLPE